MSQVIVQAEHLNLSYKTVHAVQNVSLSVELGEILAVIGQNGSGKTSVVECIEGLRKPDSGLVRVFGKDPWLHRSKVYKEMGVQLQETEYPLKIKVGELCRLFASFYERPADWELLLEQMGLDGKRKRLVQKLSAGEKQRLSIVLSLMGRPKLLVLDELTTGLDPEVRQNMWASFRNIRDRGIAILMVSHYLDEVEALADKILYLEKGEQRFFGTQQGFREYVKACVPQGQWDGNLSLEKLYLMVVPKTTGLTVEGIV
ncbi:ABC transporter ATP-binding protein [Lachnospiraceae bacterium JLR.KK009]|jgi:ABC-2 type transport system ATP-binding protein|nr:hypothetical protein C810_02846 [Lachnospiraceae bacterium A2]MCI8884269.1 ABC transporter ATP-binding protein [Lachnospiraceae bacterium]